MSTARIAPKQQRSRETVTKILDAADALFGEHGFHETQITQIIEASGVRAGSLYRFFPDKLNIAEALAERYSDSMEQYEDALPPAASVEELVLIMEIAVDLTADHQAKNPGLRALGEVFSASDKDSPLYRIRHAQVEHILGLVTTVADHLSMEERRRVTIYMAEIVDKILNSDGTGEDRSARIAEIKVILRGYLMEVLR